MSNELISRAIEATSHLLAHKGYEVIEQCYQTDESDSTYIVARDSESEELVFCEVLVYPYIGGGLPDERTSEDVRARGERVAIQYLLANSDSIDPTRIRFDEMAVCLLGESSAFARHRINCASCTTD